MTCWKVLLIRYCTGEVCLLETELEGSAAYKGKVTWRIASGFYKGSLIVDRCSSRIHGVQMSWMLHTYCYLALQMEHATTGYSRSLGLIQRRDASSFTSRRDENFGDTEG